jgi:DtxR family Mn-dependent transcriptional regulator
MILKTIEDYLEAIYKLIKKKGYARTIDIAASLNVRSPSVTEMVQKLDRDGFVVYEKHRGIILTEKGEELAKSVIKRHETLVKFLKILGIEEEIAESDACSIEHYLHPTTMEGLSKFVEFLQDVPGNTKWLEHLEHYLKAEKHLE